MVSEINDTSRSRFTAVTQALPDDFWRRTLVRIKQLVVPLVLIVVTWYAAAMVVSDPTQLPGPYRTLSQTYLVATTEDFRGYTGLYHLALTVRRALISSTLALVLALISGILMSTNDVVEDSVSDWLPFWMTAPTIVIILLSMVWFNFTETAVIFAAVVASVPFGTVNIWEGAKDIDINLLQMADAFDASTAMIWRHVYFPHLLPYLFGSYRYVLGMVWKIVVLGEVFGLSKGIGAMFRYYFQQGEIVMVFSYVILFVIVVLIIEYSVLKPLETHFFRWRD